ncbi:hypothetical protein GCM10008171_12410 [Methylopila jiangsuensis]|uniref:Uncharacterized protein n=1 Tax=Methylopila jiangsuensis TaxID=586230 RepID=A0A9W6N3E6_9HYPH|nr:hypothetical protein [Methylopila jiangsuensis]MDR6286226.1 hypothetical protein [Methylopila jiangsuensis]GLK75987.1 hypothetical protein GCM10008171_12410 [Methylopila jiangsuensis]
MLRPMHRLRHRRIFYLALLLWTALCGLVFDYMIINMRFADEPWFPALGVMVYATGIFVLTVIRFDQLKRL